MNFDTFKKKVYDNIKSHLSDEYQDYEMKFQTVKKSSGREYEALMISPKDRHMSVTPALNLNEAFKIMKMAWISMKFWTILPTSE